MSVNHVLGNNLRHLTEQKELSVSAQCRDMGIHRTQFNRYLNSETWPRDPNTLKKICDYYGVDANVLFSPIKAHHQARCERCLLWTYVPPRTENEWNSDDV